VYLADLFEADNFGKKDVEDVFGVTKELQEKIKKKRLARQEKLERAMGITRQIGRKRNASRDIGGTSPLHATKMLLQGHRQNKASIKWMGHAERAMKQEEKGLMLHGDGGGGGGVGRAVRLAMKKRGEDKEHQVLLDEIDAMEQEGCTTPWMEAEVRFFSEELNLRGFAGYAKNQRAVNNTDLVFWAIAMGALDLAFVLWKRSRVPLRSALLAQYLCLKLTEKKVKADELKRAANTFKDAALGVLDNLKDQEEARRLLLSHASDFAMLGVGGTEDDPRRCSILDLAIELIA
jgi:hypothetical protein